MMIVFFLFLFFFLLLFFLGNLLSFLFLPLLLFDKSSQSS